MPIDFPNSPSNGSTHTVNGVTWEYDGTAWNVASGGAGLRVSATAPTSPATGDLWYDSESGKVFIYYDSQWVSPAVVASVPTASAGKITGSNSEGTASTFARSDHNHSIRAVGAFYARRTQAVSLGASSGTNVVFQTEEYDVNGWYDTSNGRFTPQIAGYYLLGCFLYFDTISSGYWQVRLAVNGNYSSELILREPTDHTSYPRQGASVIAKANGTTDYFQINVFNGSSVTRSVYDASYFYGYYLGTD